MQFESSAKPSPQMHTSRCGFQMDEVGRVSGLRKAGCSVHDNALFRQMQMKSFGLEVSGFWNVVK